MSATSPKSVLLSPALPAPVFVHHQRSKRSTNSRVTKKWYYWDIWTDFTLTSFTKRSSLILFVLTSLLCSRAVASGVSPRSSSARSYHASNDEYPKFDVNDLVNLMEIFPEFKEYVHSVVKNHAGQQQLTVPLPAPAPIALSYYSGQSITDTKLDSGGESWIDPQQTTGLEERGAIDKDGYGYYDHYSSYHPPRYKYSNKGYGWGYSSGGWLKPEYHHEPYKDPHHHYQAGYELGKDVSCVLSLLGFKSWKDFTFHGILSALKKLKYVVLIGLAFKFGLVLSPLAMPLLFPVVIIGAIIKLVPLLLIILLLFKILKTSFKLKFLGRENYWKRDDSDASPLSHLWETIEYATQAVMQSESCVEKVVCKLSRSKEGATNETSTVGELGSNKSFARSNSIFLSMYRALEWLMPSRQSWKERALGEDVDEIECEKIQCSMITV